MPISLPAMKARSSLQGAVLGRAVLLQNNLGGGDGAGKNKPGQKKPKTNPECGSVDEQYLSSKSRNGKDIRERTDCSIP